MRAIDGGDVRFGAAFEPEFRDVPDDPTPFVPGPDAQFQTLQSSNNGQRIRMPYTRRSFAIEPGTFRGSWGWQFTMTASDTDWLDAILGENGGDGWSGEPQPMSFFIGYVPHDDDEIIEGAVPQSATISPQTGQSGVNVTVEGFYSDRYPADTGFALGSQPQPSEDVLRYQDATLTLDGGERMIVQDAQISIQWPSLQGIEGFGDRRFIGYEVNDMEPSINYTAVEVDDRESQLLYGSDDSMGGAVPTYDDFELALDRDGSGVKFLGETAFPQQHSESTLGESQSRVDESLDFDLTDLTAEAI